MLQGGGEGSVQLAHSKVNPRIRVFRFKDYSRIWITFIQAKLRPVLFLIIVLVTARNLEKATFDRRTWSQITQLCCR